MMCTTSVCCGPADAGSGDHEEAAPFGAQRVPPPSATNFIASPTSNRSPCFSKMHILARGSPFADFVPLFLATGEPTLTGTFSISASIFRSLQRARTTLRNSRSISSSPRAFALCSQPSAGKSSLPTPGFQTGGGGILNARNRPAAHALRDRVERSLSPRWRSLQ